MRHYLWILGVLGLWLLLHSPAGWANDWSNYFSNFGHNLVRGTRNILGAPLEIPRAVDITDKTDESPTIRAVRGLSEGTFNSIRRLGAGLWDWLIAPIPGQQEGLDLHPDTLI